MADARSRRARLYDRLGRNLIAAGGIGIIAAVLGIFVFIGRETYPLFLDAEVTEEPNIDWRSDGVPLAIGVDPYREIFVAAGPAGIAFTARDGRTGLPVHEFSDLGSVATAADRSPADGRLALGFDDGRVLTAVVEFDLSYNSDTQRIVTPSVERDEVVRLFTDEAIARVSYRHDGAGKSIIAALSAQGRLVVRVAERSRGLLGPGRLREGLFDLTDQIPGRMSGRVTAMTMDGGLRHLVLGTSTGQVQVWRLYGSARPPEQDQTFDITPLQEGGVTALAFLLGDQSLVVGADSGALSIWFEVDADGGGRAFRRIHELPSHDSAISVIAVSERDKQFLTGDASGHVALHHATSEQTFFRLDAADRLQARGQPVRSLAFAPKADGFLVHVDGARRIASFALSNPHPEVTAGVLFGRVWYEGYNEPGYVWQSTGGTDEFEPKLSMVPLVFGTIKGTVFAMLFALPLAVLAALYTAEFSTPRVRNTVKPTVEIMASLPSVILGFLAGLWLAPLLEQYIVGTAIMLLLVPMVVLAGAFGWRRLPRSVRGHLPATAELVVLTGLTLAGSAAAIWLGPHAEHALFGGALPRWLAESSSLRYDQRNCLVVGFAMGFAVVPLIFTICEDALSSVPASLRAASLGLGATRWQTAVRVVLPMALPGIFSAAMIGFGRAVGETMIVLMATGNTPILEWNVFTGMRTISANIAVELPEAPHEGTLYRILFFSGLLLFGVTFVLNTIAETVRQRLREKYRRV